MQPEQFNKDHNGLTNLAFIAAAKVSLGTGE